MKAVIPFLVAVLIAEVTSQELFEDAVIKGIYHILFSKYSRTITLLITFHKNYVTNSRDRTMSKLLHMKTNFGTIIHG